MYLVACNFPDYIAACVQTVREGVKKAADVGADAADAARDYAHQEL
jgi:hypothetical protein